MDYITTNASYTDLAKKYGVNRTNLAKMATKEKWVEQRERYTTKALTKTLKKLEEKQSERLVKLFDLTDKVLKKLADAVCGESVGTYKNLVLSDPKKLTGALKDIKEIYMIRSAADLDEQQARIEKLRRSTETNDESDEIEITILGGKEEWQN